MTKKRIKKISGVNILYKYYVLYEGNTKDFALLCNFFESNWLREGVNRIDETHLFIVMESKFKMPKKKIIEFENIACDYNVECSISYNTNLNSEIIEIGGVENLDTSSLPLSNEPFTL